VAHSLSAIKRHRQSLRRRDRNRARKTAARNAVRRVRELLAAGDHEEAQAAIREASSVLDRAARKGGLHRNNASRRKSRLERMARAAAGAVPEEAPRKRRTRTTSSSRSKKS
jgi:small subunit ribosomal protein S20